MSRDSIWMMNTPIDAGFTRWPVWNDGAQDLALVPGNLWRAPEAREIELTVVVHSITGAPDTASLELELWAGQRYLSGPGFAIPTYRKFSADELAAKVVEGKDFGIVADKSMAGTVIASRTLKHPGIMPRIRLKPTFTGGTNPAFVVSINAYVKD